MKLQLILKQTDASTNDFHCHLAVNDIVKLDATGGVKQGLVSVGSEH